MNLDLSKPLTMAGGQYESTSSRAGREKLDRLLFPLRWWLASFLPQLLTRHLPIALDNFVGNLVHDRILGTGLAGEQQQRKRQRQQ